jgi:Flp pilus assembly protein TadG
MARLRSCAGLVRLLRKADEGATLVEMALASAILFASLFGIIMISFALYTYDYVAEAAHEGARYATVRGAYCVGFSDCNVTGAQVATFVQGLNYPGIMTDAQHMTVNTSWYNVIEGNTTDGITPSISLCDTNPAGCNVPGFNSVQVQVIYNFPLNIPFWKATTLSMSSTAQLPIAQ